MDAFNESSISLEEAMCLATRRVCDAIYGALESTTPGVIKWRGGHSEGIAFRELRKEWDSPPIQVHATLRDCITIYREKPYGQGFSYYREVAGRTFLISPESKHPTHNMLAHRITAYLTAKDAHHAEPHR